MARLVLGFELGKDGGRGKKKNREGERKRQQQQRDLEALWQRLNHPISQRPGRFFLGFLSKIILSFSLS